MSQEEILGKYKKKERSVIPDTNYETVVTSPEFYKSQHTVIIDKIAKVRDDIETLARRFETHIELGSGSHPIATATTKGLMTPEMVQALVDVIRKVNTVIDNVESIDLPIGTMCWWYGDASEVPAGWHICDGTNGTLDMRGRVAIGTAAASADIGKSIHTSSGTPSLPYLWGLHCIEKISSSGPITPVSKELNNSWINEVYNG